MKMSPVSVSVVKILCGKQVRVDPCGTEWMD
jgi:hypothetical protein